MEMKGAIYWFKKVVRLCLCALLVIVIAYTTLSAQEPVKVYTIKNGKMYIELSRKIRESALDSFIAQYNLFDLALKKLVKTNSWDSLRIMGWQLEPGNKDVFVISKPLKSFKELNNSADKIILTEKHPTLAEMFPAVNNGIRYGYNRFKNKFAFAMRDEMVTFFLRNNTNAKQVMLAGSFNNWSPGVLPMVKTDSGWIAHVKLGPGKYWYKFVIDGNWNVDNDNALNENDGRGNINSVFYKTNIIFKLNSFPNAKKVILSGSFNNWNTRDLQMVKTPAGWELPLYLADGTHTYRFIVDGNWYADPENRDRLPNEYNDFNSVVRVGRSYLFKLNGFTSSKQVVLSGSFNNWRKDELFLHKTATGWELPYTLGSGNYEYKFLVDGKWITDPSNPFVTNNNEKTGNSYLIIDANYTFRLAGYSTARAVFLAGDFDNWSPTALAMKREGDVWTFSVHLSVGKHLYKFNVDGKWIIDPGNKLWEQNEYGTGNSVIWIDK